MTLDPSSGVPAEYTPELLESDFQLLSQLVVRLGSIDWVTVAGWDETPASQVSRVSALIITSGALGALATAAMVTLDDFVTAIVAATLEGAAASDGGTGS